MALQQAIGPVQGKQRAVRVISWNCNGLRTVLARNGCNSMACLLDRLSRGVAGVVCFQETKLTALDIKSMTWLTDVPGWEAYFSFCRTRSAYSGTATYVRTVPPTSTQPDSTLHVSNNTSHAMHQLPIKAPSKPNTSRGSSKYARTSSSSSTPAAGTAAGTAAKDTNNDGGRGAPPMAQWISCPQAAGSIPLAPSGQTLPEAQPVEPQALVAAAADRRQHPEKEDADSAGAELCWELLPAAYAEEGFSLHAPRLPPQHPAHAAQRAQYTHLHDDIQEALDALNPAATSLRPSAAGAQAIPSGALAVPALVTPSTMQLSSEDQACLAELEREGRCVITDHGAFVLINVYLPASSGHLPLPAKGQLQQQARQQEEPCDNEPCDKGIQGALVSKALAPAGQGPAAGTQHGDAPACRPQGPLLGQGRSLKQAQLWPGIVPVPMKASISQTAAEPQGRGDRYACLLAACKGLSRLVNMLHAQGRCVVLVGDLNIAAGPQEHCRYYRSSKEHQATFYDNRPDRAWLRDMMTCTSAMSNSESSSTQVLPTQQQPQAATGDDGATLLPRTCAGEGVGGKGFVASGQGLAGVAAGSLKDSLRTLHPRYFRPFSVWDQSQGIRNDKHGSRVDYIMISAATACHSGLFPASTRPAGCLQLHVHASGVWRDFKGSDHAPVWADLQLHTADQAVWLTSHNASCESGFEGAAMNIRQLLNAHRSGQRPNVLRELQQHGYGAHGSGVGTGRCSDFNTDRAIGNAAAKSSRSVADLFASMRNRSSAGSSSDASGGRNGSSMRGADRVHAAGEAGTCHTMLDDVHPLIATSGGGPATAATTLLVSPGASGMQQVPAEVLVTQLPPAGRASPPTVIHHTQPQIQRINYEQSLTQGQVPAKGPAAQAGAVGYSRLAAALAAKQSPAALSPSTAVTQSDPGVSPSSCAAAKLAPIFSLAKSSAAAESTGCSARNADGTTSGSIMLGPDIGVVLGARAGANRTHATSAHAPLDASAGSQRMQVEFTSSLQPAKRRKLWCENL